MKWTAEKSYVKKGEYQDDQVEWGDEQAECPQYLFLYADVPAVDWRLTSVRSHVCITTWKHEPPKYETAIRKGQQKEFPTLAEAQEAELLLYINQLDQTRHECDEIITALRKQLGIRTDIEKLKDEYATGRQERQRITNIIQSMKSEYPHNMAIEDAIERISK